jgi:gas vesicle protein
MMFAVGATIGSVATWMVIKTKYERIADEEIESIREVYYKKEAAMKTNQESETEKPSIYEMKEYLERIKENNYGNKNDDDEDDEDDEQENEEGENDMNDSPYVISPEEFGNVDDHTCVYLSYYADGVLADDWGTEVIDPEEEVGPDIASHFGEYEEDTVFVRNEKLKVDYEICRDLRTFAEVIGDEAIDQSDD